MLFTVTEFAPAAKSVVSMYPVINWRFGPAGNMLFVEVPRVDAQVFGLLQETVTPLGVDVPALS